MRCSVRTRGADTGDLWWTDEEWTNPVNRVGYYFSLGHTELIIAQLTLFRTTLLPYRPAAPLTVLNEMYSTMLQHLNIFFQLE